MKIVNTKTWGLAPVTGHSFRIERSHYVCLATFGRFALIRFVGQL